MNILRENNINALEADTAADLRTISVSNNAVFFLFFFWAVDRNTRCNRGQCAMKGVILQRYMITAFKVRLWAFKRD